MPAGTLAPPFYWTSFNDDGTIAAGAVLSFYSSGTTTPATVYKDGNLLVPWGTTVTTDAAGRAVIYFPALSLKMVQTTSLGVPLGPTVDPVGSVGLVTSGTVGIFTFFGDPTSPITAAAYPVGATVDKTHAGTSVFAIDSATLVSGTYELSGMILSVGGVNTVTAALVNLTDGATEVPLATITGTSATGQQAFSAPITFAAGGTVKSYGIKVTVNGGGTGYVWGLELVKVPTITAQTGPIAEFAVFNFAGDPTSPITSPTYPSGTSYSVCHAGSAWFVIDPGTLAAGTYNLSGMLMTTGSAAVSVGLMNLTDGLPDTPLVTISSGSTTGATVLSAPIVFPAGGAAKTFGIKALVSAGGPGFAWALALVKTA